MTSIAPQDLLDELSRVRVARPPELRRALGISAATLSRLISACGEHVCRMGRARASRYARTRFIAGLGRRLPVFRVDEAGVAAPFATLHLLWEGGHWLERPRSRELFTGLPPALSDMAPQGYLGRGFPARYPELELPPRVVDWSDDHRLVALARRGEDCVGDLVIGDESLQRFLASSPTASTPRDYPAVAQASASHPGGSSAGGERPKFGAFARGRHLLVKFAPPGDAPPARRWRELLWCEWKASQLLARAGASAARARCLDVQGWRFLEVERFDRVGARGRRAVLTLGAVDDEHFGKRDSWTAAAPRLRARPFALLPADASRLVWLDAFGQLIGNDDRHFGNVAFFASETGSLRLAPAYDMLPMALAPSGETLPPRAFEPAPPRGESIDVWPDAARWAGEYWREVEANGELDGSVRAYAEGARRAIVALAARIGAARRD